MTTVVELNDMSAVPTDAEPAGGSGGGILKDVKETETAGRKSKSIANSESDPGARVTQDGGRASISRGKVVRYDSCERPQISLCQVL